MSHQRPVVLNVAEKPSVARSLVEVFRQGAQDRGMRREGGGNQVFTHENVRFPSVLAQGSGHQIEGPSTFCLRAWKVVF